MNTSWNHIFDKSACLSKKQMKDYLSGTMSREEMHAAEVHLNSCPFCSDALDGLLEADPSEISQVLADLNPDFLSEHMQIQDQASKQQKLPANKPTSLPRSAFSIGRIAAIAACLIFCFGIIWYIEFRKPVTDPKLAQQLPATVVTDSITSLSPEQTPLAAAPEADRKTASAERKQSPVVNSNQPAIAASAAAETAAVPENPRMYEQQASDTKERADMQQEEIKTQEKAAAYKAAPMAKSMLNTSVQSDSIRMQSNTGAPVSETRMEAAKKLYQKGSWQQALTLFNQESSSDNRAIRQEARLWSAHCYIQLGNKEKARQLLNAIIDEGAPQKNEAARLLEDMDR